MPFGQGKSVRGDRHLHLEVLFSRPYLPCFSFCIFMCIYICSESEGPQVFVEVYELTPFWSQTNVSTQMMLRELYGLIFNLDGVARRHVPVQVGHTNIY